MESKDSVFINPQTGNKLELVNETLIDVESRVEVGKVDEKIPRFVLGYQDYADNFAFQWKRWHSLLSGLREKELGEFKLNELLRRTGFAQLDLNNKTILECGCGGGDDTEQLLRLPFSKVYSFDLSKAVERSYHFNDKNERLILFQASIFDIPIEDESMDIVYCHRVLQHTPDPSKALRSIMKKVKPGGYLFAHTYNKSKFFMKEFKYKYRPLTKRLPISWVAWFLDTFSGLFHGINTRLYKSRIGKKIAREFIPLYYYKSFASFSDQKLRELEKLSTFDALTPKYDLPMSWEEFSSLFLENGFEIIHSINNDTGSLCITAHKA